MLVTVVVTLCLAGGQCIERVVTDEATLSQCGGAMALQVLPAWLEAEGYTARGYKLMKWGCVIGGRRGLPT